MTPANEEQSPYVVLTAAPDADRYPSQENLLDTSGRHPHAPATAPGPMQTSPTAINMMTNLKFTDAQVGAAMGRSGQEVRQWRQTLEAAAHAQRVGVDIAKVPTSQHKVLTRIVQDAPFKHAVDLAATRKVPYSELERIVKEVEISSVGCRSDRRRRPGPDGSAAHRPRRQRCRSQRQGETDADGPAAGVEHRAAGCVRAPRAVQDRLTWMQVRAVCDNMIGMYDQMAADALRRRHATPVMPAVRVVERSPPRWNGPVGLATTLTAQDTSGTPGGR